MYWELIRFECVDSFGTIYKGNCLVDVKKSLDNQVSHYLQLPVEVIKFKYVLDNRFYGE